MQIYEDDKTYAFLDIMPRAPGHTLVIPKAPARNILDIEADDLSELIKRVQTIGRAAVKAFATPAPHRSAIQRAGRRAGRVPPACACHSTQDRRRAEPAASFKEEPAVWPDAQKIAAALSG